MPYNRNKPKLNKTKKVINPRVLIIKILYRLDHDNAFLNILLNHYFSFYQFDQKDKALIQEIAFGVTRNRKKLDYIIDQFLVNKTRVLDFNTRNILRVGIYQIFYLDRIPHYAICNESVQLSRKFHLQKKASFINAVLRNAIRKMDKIKWPERYPETVEGISTFYSYPESMVRRWMIRFGLKKCLKICQESNKKANLCLRINTLNISQENFLEKLDQQNMTFKLGQYLPKDAVIVRKMIEIEHSSMYQEGLFSIQDEASLLVARLLHPKAGEIVFDMCSAPGGKTTHMAQIMSNQGKIIAFDKYTDRLNLIKKESQRIGIDIIECKAEDSSSFQPRYQEKADKVLVDVPCSGTGVIRKKPDLKWKKFNKQSIKRLTDLQLKILEVASKYLKIGGELVYSTCSIEQEENEGVISCFLRKNKNFKLVSPDNTLEDTVTKLTKRYQSTIRVAIQTIPGISGKNIDGFFMVKIKKRAR